MFKIKNLILLLVAPLAIAPIICMEKPEIEQTELTYREKTELKEKFSEAFLSGDLDAIEKLVEGNNVPVDLHASILDRAIFTLQFYCFKNNNTYLGTDFPAPEQRELAEKIFNIIDYLISVKGWDINEILPDGNTCLFSCIETEGHCYYDIFKFLLMNGANPYILVPSTAKDCHGNHPTVLSTVQYLQNLVTTDPTLNMIPYSDRAKTIDGSNGGRPLFRTADAYIALIDEYYKGDKNDTGQYYLEQYDSKKVAEKYQKAIKHHDAEQESNESWCILF